MLALTSYFVFFFNDTATTEIYTLSLHDALPICGSLVRRRPRLAGVVAAEDARGRDPDDELPRIVGVRSEEHTSELQSRQYLVCRLLLEKKNAEIQRKVALVCRRLIRLHLRCVTR